MEDDVKLFIIEHPGTDRYTKLANQLRHMIEFELGHDTETVIGKSEGKLSVLTEEGRELFSTTVLPELKSLRFYIALC